VEAAAWQQFNDAADDRPSTVDSGHSPYGFGACDSPRRQAASTRSTGSLPGSKSACWMQTVGARRSSPPRPATRVSTMTTFSPQRLHG